MKIAKVECQVRVMQEGNINNLTVWKVGPSAIHVTEIPILRRINDISEGGPEDCSITEAREVGTVEATSGAEIQRLKSIYGGRPGNIVDQVYPGGMGLPRTLEECELPAASVAVRKQPAAEKQPEPVAEKA